MPSNPKIRASDADRERTVALLREHLAAGRLTAEEFHERLDAAYAAKTLGQLDELLADLPAIDLYELPDATLHRARTGSRWRVWGQKPRRAGGKSGLHRAACRLTAGGARSKRVLRKVPQKTIPPAKYFGG